MRGTVIEPSSEDYHVARTIFNGMIDRYPALICRCIDTEDVRTCLRYSTDHGLGFSVRGGGHNVAGSAIRESGMVIDLSAMKGVVVDPVQRRVTVRSGVRLGEMDRETQAYGLAVPAGIISDTGIAGLALGGGLGWLMGRFGLTCDNLLSANVVLADGSLAHAGDVNGGDPDLLWALRGAGANFGIVTSFVFSAYALSGVVAGSLTYSLSEASAALQQFALMADGFPDELTCSVSVQLPSPTDRAILRNSFV
ncbi:MAG: FAD-binding oxidoreductase [Gammaproteobacteria bacterium]